MDISTTVIFCLVYLGMLLGSWPGLALDRTGIALLGAISIITIKNLALTDVIVSIEVSTIAILFSFMIISAQFYYSGFYTKVSDIVEKLNISPSNLLMAVILIAGILSSVLINDIVCLAMPPLTIRTCQRRSLNPIPFLLGIACGANIGSALTLVGNPQNILIGQALHLSFARYLLDSAIPCLFGWLVTWLVIKYSVNEDWYEHEVESEMSPPSYNRWQTMKGIVVMLIVITLFLVVDTSRDRIALAAAGVILLSRRMTSQMMLNFIDWQLLVLFIGLFIVNHSLVSTDLFHSLLALVKDHNISEHPVVLFLTTVVLSNLFSNVPAVMLLLPMTEGHLEGAVLALSNTLAGNLSIIGSIANLILVTQAANLGVNITWKKHFRVGFPIALLSLSFAAFWLYIRHYM